MNVDDLFGLEADSGLHVVDPDLTRVEPAPLKPLPAAPVGPTRTTTFVPSERTSLHLGNDVRSPRDPRAVLFDRGIAGKTDHHVQLHVMAPKGGSSEPTGEETPTTQGAAAEEERTFFRLGGPPVAGGPFLAANATGGYAASYVPGQIPSVGPAAHNVWPGYAMLTGGSAVHESRYNHVIVSGQAEARLAAESAVQVGTRGNVYITADPGKSVATYARNVGGDLTVATDESNKLPGLGPVEFLADKVVTFVAGLVSAFMSQVLTMEEAFTQQYGRSPPDRDPRTGWAAVGFGDVAGTLLKQAGVVAGIAGLVTKDSSQGRVALYGSDSVKAVGAFSSALHGGVTTSVSSGLATLVSADFISAMTSLVIAAVSGTFTSIGGTLSAKLSSQAGSAEVSGRTSAALISGGGKIFMTSGQNAQLNSTDGIVFVHGRQGVYIGAGGGARVPQPLVNYTPIEYQDGAGFAIDLDRNRIALGPVENANRFTTYTRDRTKMIYINRDLVHMRHGDAAITLTNNDIKFEATGRVRFESNTPGAEPPRALEGVDYDPPAVPPTTAIV